MKASPRFREATAYIKLRHQPAQVNYPLLALHIAANPQAYDAGPLNVRPDVSPAQFLNSNNKKIIIVRQFIRRRNMSIKSLKGRRTARETEFMLSNMTG